MNKYAKDMSSPLVSICCLSYNHAPFINKCLDGFLMQKTTFDIEILIHDDCSTDGTDMIIREYANKYPSIIKPLFEIENKYSNGFCGKMDTTFNYCRASGKYIATCEGDDFWTDPLKLQKQVNFMENHPDYSVCFHDFVVYNTWTNKYSQGTRSSTQHDYDVTLDMFLNSKIGIGQPLTMLFRRDMYDFKWQTYHNRFCDTMEIMHLLTVGKGRFLSFCGGQYNLHLGGVSTSNPDIRRSWEFCEDVQQMWDSTHHMAVKKKYIDVYKWRLDICNENNLTREYIYTIWMAIRHKFSFGLCILKYAIKKVIKKYYG